MGTYIIASQEGVERYGVEVGEKIDLDLNPDEERALIAAAWLEHAKAKKES